MNLPEWQRELQTLCEAILEGQQTLAQVERLEQLVLEHPEGRRYYVEYLHQHGSLQWSAAEWATASQNRSTTPTLPFSSARKQKLSWLLWGSALLAASLLLGLGLNFATRTFAPPSLATLVSGKGCKWDSGTLPTEDGARLSSGRLRLAEGIARITFDNGVAVTLEAPADFELISAQRCILHGGRLIARVPGPAIGFTIDTPTAVVKDLGTEFGVNVKNEGMADVQVFEGMVDVKHRTSGTTERLLQGENRRFEAGKVSDFDPQAERPSEEASKPIEAGTKVLQISTAMGRGKDAYVQPKFPSEHSSDILLLVKNTKTNGDYNRKAYLGLDLASSKGLKILDAELILTFAPTGMGFASEVPDATFAVYGLADESLDNWDERTMRWRDAPANRDGGASLDLSKVVRLGTFEMAQGVQQGTRSISGQALVNFLNRDTNSLATFIVVRETPGSGRTDLVHGFAGKNHPRLPPPTLKLTVAPKQR